MKSYNIAVIGGDGTGPEVVREAVKVLDVAAKKFDLKLNYTDYDLGGDRYLRTGEALPDSVLAELRKFPAILTSSLAFWRRVSSSEPVSSWNSISISAR